MRTVVIWLPDWPVTAAAREAGYSPNEPLAVLDKGRIFACSKPARDVKVRRGMRVREAQSRCPDLVALRYDPTVDARAFEPVIDAVEAIAPGVEVIRPGVCAVAARGPSRYFGGEHAFADVLHNHLDVVGYSCVIGIADGPFAAEQAARSGLEVGYAEFPPGESATSLAGLSIDLLERPELVDLLRRLGIRTLGQFAELPRRQVLARFGTDGALAHRLASGDEDRPLAPRRLPPDLSTGVDLEPAVERVDQVAFAVKGAADRLIAGLTERDLVCTCLLIELHTENGEVSERRWRHPRWFSAADVIDRVRWQAQGRAGSRRAEDSDHEGLVSGVTGVRLMPEEVARTGGFAEGLWGDRAPEEHVHRGLSRIQSMLGHEAVLTAVLGGGRSLTSRVTLVPWGDEPMAERPADPPWPGRLPMPAPATVLPTPEPIDLLGATLDNRGDLLEPPKALRRRGEPATAIERWAGPWPVTERWWDESKARHYVRLQVLCADGRAYTLLHEHARWWIEACHD
ncbi:DNA polymerase Y family protein [Flindersiella endophytica]